MRRPIILPVAVAVALLAAPALACLWDNDTLLDERRGLPGIAEIIAGKWERHSPLFYEHRVKAMTAHLEQNPNDLAAWDNLAVAYEKLGDQDKAIETILKKDQIKPGEYTTHANLGTFYLHKSDFENGVAHIRKALEINPEAHFGREKYQLMVVEYLLEAKRDPKVYERGSFILPELLGGRGALDQLGPDPYVKYLEQPRRPGDGRRDDGKTDAPIEGVVGMIRFGTGTSPHLFHALGDLLAYRGDRHLAFRAYRRSLDLGHPRPDLIQKAIENVKAGVEHHDELSELKIAAERAAAEAWVKAYQQFEDDLVRAGAPPQSEADYAPFYRAHGTARPAVSAADATGNVLRKLLRAGAAALIGLLVLLALLKLWVVLRRRTRRTTAAA
jgi:tetratricopeptide (TPR) repeat protein